jgi:hypothetical protein
MNYFGFWSSFYQLLDPDPGGKFNADPCGSGSETLVRRHTFCARHTLCAHCTSPIAHGFVSICKTPQNKVRRGLITLEQR